jgi:hypothetical protein
MSDSTYASLMSSCNFSVVAVPSKECSAAQAEADRELSDFIDPYDVLIDVCLAPNKQQQKKLVRSRVSDQAHYFSFSLCFVSVFSSVFFFRFYFSCK